MPELVDAVFPGLAAALDPERMRNLLSRSLPECNERLELSGFKIAHARYTPAKSGLFRYQAELTDRSTGRVAPQLFSAELLRPDEAPPQVPTESLDRYRALRGRLIRTPMVHLPEICMAVYVFPLDPLLPTLIDACDPTVMRQKLAEMWVERRLSVREVTIRPLSFAPQARATVALDVLSESTGSGRSEMRHLVGKIDHRRGASRRFLQTVALWRAAGSRVRVAPPIGFIPSLHLSLQERLDGVPLGTLAGTPGFVKSLGQTADAVGALHRLNLPLEKQRKPDRSMASTIRRHADLAAALRPQDRLRLEHLRDALVAAVVRRAEVVAPIHGDLHPTNVLVDDGGVALIDTDSMAYGDPHYDVGRFLSSLRTSSLRLYGRHSGLSAAGDAFLRRFAVTGPIDEPRVRLFEAASLLGTACSAFSLQRSGWHESMGSLLDEAERTFALSEPRSAPRSSEPVRRAPAPRKFDVDWLTERDYMKAALEPLILESYGAEIDRCQVESRSAAKTYGCVHYLVSGRLARETWSASLAGLSWTTRRKKARHERLVTLRETLGDTPERLLVPRPVGFLPEIGLQVVEPPVGVRLSSLLGTGDGSGAVRRLARALAVLDGVSAELGTPRPLSDVLAAVRDRAERLKALDAQLARTALRLVDWAAEQGGSLPERWGPVFSTVSPDLVVLTDEGVGLSIVTRARQSQPHLNAGEFLARLALRELEGNGTGSLRFDRDGFRESYAMHTGMTHAELDVFETIELVRLACAGASTSAGMARAHSLCSRAPARSVAAPAGGGWR